jgi:hypothetical protein
MRSFLCNLPGRFSLVFSLLLLLPLAASPTAVQAAAAAPQEQVHIVAHLPLHGMHVNQMFLQQRDNKSYLFLHRPQKNAFALVDVTTPSKPVLLSRRTMQESSRTQVNPPASDSVLALAVSPDSTPQYTPASATTAADSAKLPSETVQLVDFSDPQSPKALKTFHGVTSMFPDDAHKLIYLVNGDGLWIIRHHAVRPMPMCTSEEAMNPLPDCQ